MRRARALWTRIVVGAVVALAVLVPGPVRFAPAAAAAVPTVAADVTLVGDGLVQTDPVAYRTALVRNGSEVRALSAAPGRTLRYGWRCRQLVNGTVVDQLVATPISGAGTCNREGLEELRDLALTGGLGAAVVLAVGAHDALADPPATVAGKLAEVRRLVGARPLYLVGTAAAPGPKRVLMQRYNAAAATWCAADGNCAVIGWQNAATAVKATSYEVDQVQLTAAATTVRAEYVAVKAPKKPPRTTTTTTSATTTTTAPTTTTSTSSTTTTTSSTTTSTSTTSTSTTSSTTTSSTTSPTTSTTAPPSSGLLIANDGEVGRYTDGVGAFRVVCTYSHSNRDDPIVKPNLPGAAHLHQFFGSRTTDAFTTTDSLRAGTSSTCPGGTANMSGYWNPALVASDGSEIRPEQLIVYYKSGYGGVAASAVQPMPRGLRMVAGEPMRTEPDTRPSWQRHVFWSCVHLPEGSYTASTAEMQACAAGWDVVMTVQFPQCWDGVHLDSVDHLSHMAYPDNGCPATHPVPIPAITLNTYWYVASSTAGWMLSSDMYAGPAGRSGHADWWNGWDPSIVDIWMRYCVNAGLDCGAYNLGDGRRLI